MRFAENLPSFHEKVYNSVAYLQVQYKFSALQLHHDHVHWQDFAFPPEGFSSVKVRYGQQILISGACFRCFDLCIMHLCYVARISFNI